MLRFTTITAILTLASACEAGESAERFEESSGDKGNVGGSPARYSATLCASGWAIGTGCDSFNAEPASELRPDQPARFYFTPSAMDQSAFSSLSSTAQTGTCNYAADVRILNADGYEAADEGGTAVVAPDPQDHRGELAVEHDPNLGLCYVDVRAVVTRLRDQLPSELEGWRYELSFRRLACDGEVGDWPAASNSCEASCGRSHRFSAYVGQVHAPTTVDGPIAALKDDAEAFAQRYEFHCADPTDGTISVGPNGTTSTAPRCSSADGACCYCPQHGGQDSWFQCLVPTEARPADACDQPPVEGTGCWASVALGDPDDGAIYQCDPYNPHNPNYEEADGGDGF